MFSTTLLGAEFASLAQGRAESNTNHIRKVVMEATTVQLQTSGCSTLQLALPLAPHVTLAMSPISPHLNPHLQMTLTVLTSRGCTGCKSFKVAGALRMQISL